MEFITTPWAAEQNAARQMRDVLGITDATVTQATGDGGIDVTSMSAVAQVKCEAHKTGRPAVQNLFGARGPRDRRSLLFFSSGGYSDHAVAYAEEASVALFTYTAIGKIEPVNFLASEMIRIAATDRLPVKTPRLDTSRLSGPPQAGRVAVSLTPGTKRPASAKPEKSDGPRLGRLVAVLVLCGGVFATHQWFPSWFPFVAGIALFILIAVALAARDSGK